MQQLPLLGVVDSRLEPHAALTLAEQVLAEPRGLVTTFNTTKLHGEATQRHPTGFAYRSFVSTWAMKMRANDGYVIAQDNGQGGTRLSFHESKRYAIIVGCCLAAYLAIVLLVYFLAFGSSTPTVTQPTGFGQQPTGFGQQPPVAASSSGSGLWWLIPGILICLYGVAQLFELLTAPKKVIDRFNQVQMHGFGAPPGYPGQPQPGFPGQPQGAFPPPQPFAAPGGQPGFPPPQPQAGGFPPPPQSRGGFAPPQPQGGFAPPPMDLQKPPPPNAGSDIDDKLRELAQLRDGGIISPADFDQAKAALEAKRG